VQSPRREMRRVFVLGLLVALGGCGRRHATAGQRGADRGQADGARASGGAELAIVSEDARLRRDEPLPATSPLFDGARVRLRGGRGETLALHVLTRSHDATVALTLAPTSAPSSAGARTPSSAPTLPARVDAFVVQWLNVREPSTAMYGPSRGAGVYPDPLQPSRQPVHGDALFDVVIAADAVPGVYRGTLTVATRTLPLELTVEPVRIDVDDDPLVWIWYMPREIARAHGLPDDDGALLPLERRYHALARAHGAYLASDLPVDRFLARQSLMRGTHYWPVELDLSSLQSAQHDVQQWLNQFASRSQTAFTIPIDEPHSAEERAATRAAGERIGRHDKLLRAVTAPPSADLAGAMDVFIGPASRPPHRWTYNGTPPAAGSMVLDAAGPSLRTWGWIAQRYGVELWYAWEGTYFADRYNGGGPTDVLNDPLTFDQRRKRLRNPDWGNGDGVLFYPGPSPSQAPGRSSSEGAGKSLSEGPGKSPSEGPGKSPSEGPGKSPSEGPGKSPSEGPGKSPNEAPGKSPGEPVADGPWPSLRLKALRRGLQDRLLLRALERCGAGDAAAAATRALVPRALDEGAGAASWPDDPAAWEAARGQLYDLWRARCGQTHG
jgi:hypothetical protein